MKHVFTVLLLLSVCGCGLEVAGTAATSASIKKQEIEQGRKTMKQVEDRIGQINLESADRMNERGDE